MRPTLACFETDHSQKNRLIEVTPRETLEWRLDTPREPEQLYTQRTLLAFRTHIQSAFQELLRLLEHHSPNTKSGPTKLRPWKTFLYNAVHVSDFIQYGV